MTRNVRPFLDFLWALAGPIVWATHFFLVYGVEAVVCTRADSPSVAMRWIVAGATAVALCALIIVVMRQRKDRDAALFLREVSIILAFVSMAAIAGAGISGLSLSACLSPAG